MSTPGDGATSWLDDLVDDDDDADLDGQSAPQPRDVVVCGVSGGVGTSVISSLLADHRAASGMASSSWWADLSGNDTNVPDRFGVQLVGENAVASTVSGATFWRPPIGSSPGGTITSIHTQAGTTVVDAGARALSLTSHLASPEAEDPLLVLVVACRPDNLNRARQVLSAWDQAGLLPKTVVALTNTTAAPAGRDLTELARQAFTSKVRAVVAFGYEPELATGTSLLGATQATPSLRQALTDLAAATSGR